jgi:hypothetical protein
MKEKHIIFFFLPLYILKFSLLKQLSLNMPASPYTAEPHFYCFCSSTLRYLLAYEEVRRVSF